MWHSRIMLLRLVFSFSGSSSICAEFLFNYASVKEMNNPISVLGKTRVMRHRADRGAAAMQIA